MQLYDPPDKHDAAYKEREVHEIVLMLTAVMYLGNEIRERNIYEYSNCKGYYKRGETFNSRRDKKVITAPTSVADAATKFKRSVFAFENPA